MRNWLFVFLYLIPAWLSAQALQNINYSYLYAAESPFTFEMKPILKNDHWRIFFQLHVRQPDVVSVDNYTIEWDLRDDLKQKEGVPVFKDTTKQPPVAVIHGMMSGFIDLDKGPNNFIVVATVKDAVSKQAWVYYTPLADTYPVNGYLAAPDGTSPAVTYFNTGDSLALYGQRADAHWTALHYAVMFPPAAPAFADAGKPVSSIMQVDSTFTVPVGVPLPYLRTGLYLMQRDTSKATGVAFSVYNDYPRYTRLESLVDPLIYICTKKEFDKLKEARGDKKPFDRTILSITKDRDRAKNFMRSYFQRVEQANEYFNSYKEGWKTDRGMIYIIFGPPDEVYKFIDREVWAYKNTSYKVTFDFVRSGTLFDPDNYVLLRDKKYRETWYRVIDLWRNVRF